MPVFLSHKIRALVIFVHFHFSVICFCPCFAPPLSFCPSLQHQEKLKNGKKGKLLNDLPSSDGGKENKRKFQGSDFDYFFSLEK